MTSGDEVLESVTALELARLRMVETAARELLERSHGRRSATAMLEGVAALRGALDGRPPPSSTGRAVTS
jgi:hypothetical protein